MAKRRSAASKTVASAMRRRKRGTLKSSSGQTVRSRKQAIAIGLNEARAKGADVPAPPSRRTAKRPATTTRRRGAKSATRQGTRR